MYQTWASANSTFLEVTQPSQLASFVAVAMLRAGYQARLSPTSHFQQSLHFCAVLLLQSAPQTRWMSGLWDKHILQSLFGIHRPSSWRYRGMGSVMMCAWL